MTSRNAGSSPQDNGVVLQAPTIAGKTEGGGGSSSSSQFAGIDNPEAIGILMDFIRQTAGGGTAEQRRQRAERNTEIQRTRALGGDYSKSAAFADAADLMAQNLRRSLEANMPAISKSIQGAGTSASSMQGLLSQKLATESAQAAGALGAEQAKSYGNISAQLQGVLEALTRIDPSIETNLLKALELTRVSRAESRSVQNPTTSTTASGGGSYYQPIQQQQPQGYSDYGDAVSQAVTGQPSAGPGQGFIVNNDTGAGQMYTGGGQFEPFSYRPAEEEVGPSFLDQQYAEGWGYGD